MRTIKTCTVGLASLLITGFGATAPAATKSDEFADLDSMMLEEIVVTARRREESAQTVPVAVTAFTADDITNRSAVVISDVARETPSLTMQARSSDRNTQLISLRGQLQVDSVATLDPSVGTYLNDIYVARGNGANFELFDVDRIEILAGPQGTLYGRNTTGGAVKLITTPASPKGTLSGYAAVTGGNYNARRIEGAMNVPFNDKFAVRVAGLDATRDGYGKDRVGTLAQPATPNVFGLPLDGSTPFTVRKVFDTDNKNTKAGRVSALFQPTEKLSFNLVSDYSKSLTNGATGYSLGNSLITLPPGSVFGPLLNPAGNYTRCSKDFYTSCDDFAPKADATTEGVALTTAYDTRLGTAKLIYGYRDVDSYYTSDLEGSPIPYESIIEPSKVHQNSVEAQLQGQTAALDYTAGLYYFNEAGDEIFQDETFGGVSRRYIDSHVNNESKSIYGQTGYAVTKTVRLTVGARYTEDDKALLGHAYALPSLIGGPTGLCLYGDSPDGVTPPMLTPSPNAENCKSQHDKSFSHLSWTAGVDWQPRDGILAYLKTSDGYRSGGQNVRGLSTASERPFDAESIRDIELGVKSRLYDRVRLNLTYYHSHYANIQTTEFLPLPFPQNTTTIVVNQGTAKIDGLELLSTLIASDKLSFDLAGSYNNTNYSIGTFVAAFTPKYKGSVATNLFLPVAYGDWSARLSYDYQSQLNATGSTQAQSSIPETTLGSRGLVDARLAVNLKEYDTTVSLFATNLTNRKYFEFVELYAVANPNNPSALVDNFNRLQVGTPRMFGVEMRKRF